MSTAERVVTPILYDDQRLGQREFHELYETTPERFRADLIGGSVRMPCPTGNRHDGIVWVVALWTGTYRVRTPGVTGGIEASLILDDTSEVHADGFLRIEPERGGQTWPSGIYLGECPEMVVEIAPSSGRQDGY